MIQWLNILKFQWDKVKDLGSNPLIIRVKGYFLKKISMGCPTGLHRDPLLIMFDYPKSVYTYRNISLSF